MSNLIGKRFVFCSISMICVTCAACYLNFTPDDYFKIVGTIVGLYVTGQSYTDVQEARVKKGNA